MDGITEAAAFTRWYTAGSAGLPHSGRLIDGSTYPCSTCLCAYKEA